MERFRHKNEWCFRALLLCHFQRREPVEIWQPVIGEDHIRSMLVQFPGEFLPGHHTMRFNMQSGFLQLVANQHRISLGVFQM